jgi:NAD-dependent deacetylase
LNLAIAGVVTILRPMLETLADIIARSSEGAVLTGAGISAESGVPTFRGKEGLWGKFRPEQLASVDGFMAHPEAVWEWYNWRRQLISEVSPNPGHYALRDMAQFFDRFTLITQNVDNLHQAAGSTGVLELHGNIYRNKCMQCGVAVDGDIEISPGVFPTCARCGGKIRPDVVWFGESLPQDVMEEAFRRAERAEVFFSIGTSALVQPAASLPWVAKRHGATLVEINPEVTPVSDLADFRFAARSGELLPELVELLKIKTQRPADDNKDAPKPLNSESRRL